MYSAIAGLKGYMPNLIEIFDNYDLAVEFLAEVHEMTEDQALILEEDGYIDLDLHMQGNEYCEITLIEKG